ncbi:MAG: pyruvate flavodoxin/ferredoxin oxidoreductase [Ignavibacteriales bacterium]|nr:pyruvate flavodoxin/ferredoxin oxidoreductase [Ignavibacteriales bacterium]
MSFSSSVVQLRSGNQMMAEGAIQAGCKFFAGYPITPATGIFKTMIDLLPANAGVALSAPDEISAIAYCIGASMRGFKTMTATSGPGWSLMIESVQYALMTETPLVVALVQRLGPSTGGATQGGQGDVLLAEFCTSGGYTLPVLCPTNAKECFELTILAFTWSEILRMPVILLSDKETGMTVESIDYSTLSNATSQNRPSNFAFRDYGEFQKEQRKGTYYIDALQEIPTFAPVGGDRKVTATGSAHDKQGKLQKNSPETIDMLIHLEEKLRWRHDDFSLVNMDLQESAKTLVISYGITSRAAKDAVGAARNVGHAVSSLVIQSLFPIPVKKLAQALDGIERVVVVEENMHGLYRSVLERYCNGQRVQGVNKIGAMITPKEILNAILG